MAKETIIKGTGAYGKDEQSRKSEIKLSQKLQEELESAILRLYENPVYCDVELIVESDSILTHSCILQARVSRFYKFLVTECQVLRKNGFSSIAVHNVSFVTLKNFVEKIYKNVDLSEIEECIIQILLGRRTEFKKQNTNLRTSESSVKKSESSHITLTPETDLFYTPKCSPSEIQKPFGQSYSDSPVKKKDNDITCYYKIVSVDDIQIDEKADPHADGHKNEACDKEDEHLEKELAEQDELFLSFKSIFSKVNKAKAGPHPNTGLAFAKKVESPRLRKKVQSNVMLSDENKKQKERLPLCRPNLARDSGGNTSEKCNSQKNYSKYNGASPLSLRRKLEVHSGTSTQEAVNSVYSSEMDVSAAGADSGLETSSSCHPEVSPRENTVSETSGVDLTEAAINEDIPHDEETGSTKPAESINSSSSSDVGTWDVNDENRAGFTDEEFKTSVIDTRNFMDSEEINDKLDYSEKESNEFIRDTLNEDELARLDAMEKNIRECERFLDMERKIFYCFDNNSVIESEPKSSIKTSLVPDQTISVLESVKDVILQNKLIFPNDKELERENNNLTAGEVLSDDIYVRDEQLNSFSNPASEGVLDLENFKNDGFLDNDILCRNMINNERNNDNCVVFERSNSRDSCKTNEAFVDEHFSSLAQQNYDSEVYNVNTGDILQVKTPPCSPRHLPKVQMEADTEKKPDLVFPDVKCSYNNTNSIIPAVNNYFIDASSLLDDDEIISPPVSLLNFKTADNMADTKKEENEEVSSSNYESDKVKQEYSDRERDKLLQIEEERRQGELIFKSSIPHFSRHEVEKTDEVMERLREETADLSGVTCHNENEQVVPSAVVEADTTGRSSDPETTREINQTDSHFSLPATLPLDKNSPKIEQYDENEEPKSLSGSVKRIDAESLPIVSGGLVPEDFSNSSSHISSPHLRRRNESAPILSGGMEYVEEKKTERKSCISQGAAWVVSFTDEKPRRRKQTATTTTSESDLESLELNYDIPDNEQLKETGSELKEVHLSNTQFTNSYNLSNAKENNNEEKPNQRTSNSIEKSASLGYFIDFSKDSESNLTEKEEEKSRTKQNAKKNIFSMFIDMNDEPNVAKNPPSLERQNTYEKKTKDQESALQEEVVKKPFYMFIESDSPAVKRKTINLPLQKRLLKSFDGAAEELQDSSKEKNSEPSTKRSGNNDNAEKTFISKDFKGSSQSLLEVSSTNEDIITEKEPRTVQQTRHSKLPLPLCKSSSLSAVNGDAKIVVWSEKKESKCEDLLSRETWLRTNDIQVRYKGKREDLSGSDEHYAKKGSSFLISEEPSSVYRKKEIRKPNDTRGFHLRTVEETRSPFKSPEERDSGVIVTEESDDSFVKLSDMDNYKNPYLESNKKSGVNAMSQSIPEGSWIESKTVVKGAENENLMSKSIGTGLVKSNSGTTFPSDKNATRSFSRLLPNLNLTNSFGRKSLSNMSSGKQDTDPSDTQVSEVSEISSMQSSIEPSALETSTSETDVSCHNGTSRLGEDLLRMFLEEISPDVIVEVGGRRVKAHKCILSSRCQYFAAMLSGGWVESAGNVISLQGFSYNSVHFALCHIYSGENRIPDSLNIIELATLADMLCLEGLKEVISHTLKVKYCHCFHQPCDECHVGVLDCLPVAAAYGLDDLYRKCLRWITKHFVKVWPSKTFASLPKELLDKCYQHHVVHMTVENVLDTILKIDTVRGSLPNVRWSETISRLVTKLHDAAVKYIADHFSSILTSDNFLALGKEAGWSVERLEESLMKATKCLPPEQACWSHARLHRILTVAKGPDPPSEMDWNGNFIDLLQCISGHVENSLIKQAPRAAKSKAWRQMEPELRSRIQERACLVLPDDAQSPKPKRTGSLKRESRLSSTPSSAARANTRNLEIRHMKLAMTQQVNRAASLGRLQHQDQRNATKDLRTLKPASVTSSSTKKIDNTSANIRKPAAGIPEIRKATPSRFMDVKSRYLEPKSPQKMISDKAPNASNIRKTRPLSSSDSSRNCSPLNANIQGRAGIANTRQHRDSVVSTESATSEGKRDRSYVSARSDTSSVKTLSRLTADDNMSTDSLFTDSLYSEKDATTKKSDDPKSKGKENMRKITIKSVANSGVLAKPTTNSANTRRFGQENSAISAYRSNGNRKLIASTSDSKVTPPKRFPATRITNVNQKASPGRASLASPRNSTNRNVIQKTTTKYDANVINGNTVKKKEVDVENNKNSVKDDKRPSTVSRSGTFLKDEPTILKKPQAEDVESSF